MQYRITIDDRKVRQWFAKMPEQINIRGNRGLEQYGNHLVKSLLQSAHHSGIRQFRRSRSMFTSTRYVKQKNQGYVMMPKSGLYQDRAKPHYVSITRNKPLLYAWARQKGFQGPGFYFRPKPFIKQGIRNSMKRLNPIMRTQIRAAIRESH